MKISSGDEAQEQFGNLLIIAGSLPGDEIKDRSLQLPSGIEFIFVPADNFVDTLANKNPIRDPFGKHGPSTMFHSPIGESPLITF